MKLLVGKPSAGCFAQWIFVGQQRQQGMPPRRPLTLTTPDRLILLLLVVLLTARCGHATLPCLLSGSTYLCGARQLTVFPSDSIPASATNLSLERNQLTVLADKAFGASTQLTQIHLEYNQISSVNVLAFAGMINLKTLFLDNNQIAYLPGALFESSPHLHFLHLSSNRLETLTAGLFKPFSNVTIHVYLDGNPLKKGYHLCCLVPARTDQAQRGSVVALGRSREVEDFFTANVTHAVCGSGCTTVPASSLTCPSGVQCRGTVREHTCPAKSLSTAAVCGTDLTTVSNGMLVARPSGTSAELYCKRGHRVHGESVYTCAAAETAAAVAAGGSADRNASWVGSGTCQEASECMTLSSLLIIIIPSACGFLALSVCVCGVFCRCKHRPPAELALPPAKRQALEEHGGTMGISMWNDQGCDAPSAGPASGSNSTGRGDTSAPHSVTHRDSTGTDHSNPYVTTTISTLSSKGFDRRRSAPGNPRGSQSAPSKEESQEQPTHSPTQYSSARRRAENNPPPVAARRSHIGASATVSDGTSVSVGSMSTGDARMPRMSLPSVHSSGNQSPTEHSNKFASGQRSQNDSICADLRSINSLTGGEMASDYDNNTNEVFDKPCRDIGPESVYSTLIRSVEPRNSFLDRNDRELCGSQLSLVSSSSLGLMQDSPDITGGDMSISMTTIVKSPGVAGDDVGIEPNPRAPPRPMPRSNSIRPIRSTTSTTSKGPYEDFETPQGRLKPLSKAKSSPAHDLNVTGTIKPASPRTTSIRVTKPPAKTKLEARSSVGIKLTTDSDDDAPYLKSTDVATNPSSSPPHVAERCHSSKQ
eukprot:scpid48012/ scgid22920/ Leucine-rich repeat transmembrane neuronal protein 2; Leucine-rich repeat neuronal 2 protein